jgi:hypothetical protein
MILPLVKSAAADPFVTGPQNSPVINNGGARVMPHRPDLPQPKAAPKPASNSGPNQPPGGKRVAFKIAEAVSLNPLDLRPTQDFIETAPMPKTFGAMLRKPFAETTIHNIPGQDMPKSEGPAL